MTLTAGQRKFLKALANGEHLISSPRVVDPMWKGEIKLVQPRPDALFPFIVGCNHQSTNDYVITDEGRAAIA